MRTYKYSYKKRDFNILKNGRGDLMLLIRSFEGDVEHPQLIYDGKQIATLYKSKNNLITLSLEGIPLTLRENLAKAKNLLIYETNKDKIIRQYSATVYC